MSHFSAEHSRGADLAYGDGPDWGAGFGGAGTTAGRSPVYDDDDLPSPGHASISARSHRTGHSNHSGHSHSTREYAASADGRALALHQDPHSASARPRSVPPAAAGVTEHHVHTTAVEPRRGEMREDKLYYAEDGGRRRGEQRGMVRRADEYREGYFDHFDERGGGHRGDRDRYGHGGGGHRDRDRDRDRDHHHRNGGRGHDEPTSPLDKAKEFMGDKFSHSRKGLGASVIGALVGGYAGRQANGGFERYRHSRGYGGRRGSSADDSRNRNQLISTVVGAAVGALGANAIQKRHHDGASMSPGAGSDSDRRHGHDRHNHRDRDGRGREVHWDGERERERDGRSRARSGGPIALEDRDMFGGRRGRDDSRPPAAALPGIDRARSRGGGGDSRSWADVDDWVYDDDGRGKREREREREYRY